MNKFIGLLGFILITFNSFSHGNHKAPDTLPPFGPNGGDYAKMTVHYFEIISKNREVNVFVLEPDLLSVAEDAVVLSIAVRSQYGKYSNIRFQKKGKGYLGRYKVPTGKGLVYFQVSVKIDGKVEKGTVKLERSNL